MLKSLQTAMAKDLPEISPLLSRLKGAFAAAESRLSVMSRRRVALLVLALALGFAVLGVVFGVVLSPYEPSATPPLDSGKTNGDLLSYTGIIRILDEPKEGASYYLELDDKSRVLLKSTTIDISFFKDSSVTLEGVVVDSADGTEQILFVNQAKIK